jgi:hypothetical protein
MVALRTVTHGRVWKSHHRIHTHRQTSSELSTRPVRASGVAKFGTSPTPLACGAKEPQAAVARFFTLLELLRRILDGCHTNGRVRTWNARLILSAVLSEQVALTASTNLPTSA